MRQKPEGVLIVDANARTLYSNARMAEILETSKAKMLGQLFFRYVHPEDVDFAKELLDSQNYGDTNFFRFRLCKEDGSAIWVEMLGSPIVDAHKRVIGTLGIFKMVKSLHSEDETLRLTVTAGYRG